MGDKIKKTLRQRDIPSFIKNCHSEHVEIIMQGGLIDDCIKLYFEQIQLILNNKLTVDNAILTKTFVNYFKNLK